MPNVEIIVGLLGGRVEFSSPDQVNSQGSLNVAVVQTVSQTLEAILEFGCGCGRITRAFHFLLSRQLSGRFC